jgi:uncharacterized protein YheU (UPF0270 family)
MDIPWQKLLPTTLNALIEEFVTRQGTDYGEQEMAQEFKVKQVHRLLLQGKVRVVFDPETESCDLRETVFT